jgi:hypothetical protein
MKVECPKCINMSTRIYSEILKIEMEEFKTEYRCVNCGCKVKKVLKR